MQNVESKADRTLDCDMGNLCQDGYLVERRLFAGEVEYVLVRCPCGGISEMKISNDNESVRV